MRLYTFTHFMLSSMAQGIQPLHATVEMFNKYTPTPYNNFEMVDEYKLFLLREWAYNYKTAICLNGGVSTSLNDMYNFLDDIDNIYPWAEFYEDDSLGGLMTSIALVIPAKIYKMAEFQRRGYVEFDTDSGFYRMKERADLTNILKEDFDTLITLLEGSQYSTFEATLVSTLNKYSLAR